MSDCIFCKIVAGEAPCHTIYRDEQVIAFLDLFPSTAGHALVVTAEHFENLFEASSEALGAVVATSRRVAWALRRELAPAGLGVFQLNGAAAGQTVFHYHMHLVPRREGEGLSLHGREQGDDAELASLAARLSAALPD